MKDLKDISRALLTDEKFVTELKNLYPNSNIYLVGGLVRDCLRGLEGNDYDLVVEGVLFDDLIEFLKDAGGELDLVGQSFLVIKYRTAIRQYDISVPRTDRNTGLGHQGFEIKSCETIEEDLARRDFTINAMAYNIFTDELVDPLDGQNDLENKVVNVTYGMSFIEDPLRIIRALRFCANFGFQLSGLTHSLIMGAKELLSTVSFERFVVELEKLKSNGSIALFANTCFHYKVLPNLLGVDDAEDSEERYNIFLNNCYSPVSGPEFTIAMLYYSHNLRLDSETLPLKYSKRASVIQRLTEIEHRCHDPGELSFTLIGDDLKRILRLADISHETVMSWDGHLPLSKLKLASELAISGHDLVHLGYKGPAIGEAIMQARIAVSFFDLENSKEKILEELAILAK